MHPTFVYCASFCTDADYRELVVTGAFDGTMRFWLLESKVSTTPIIEIAVWIWDFMVHELIFVGAR